MEEHHTHNPSSKSNKGIWYVLAIVLLLIFVFGLASHKKKQETSNNMPITSPSGFPERAKTGSVTFNMSPSGQQGGVESSFTVGSAKTVSVTMDTQSKSVLGYTLVIQYDPAQLTIGKITSAVPAFTASQIEATPGYIVVDGVKSSPDNTPVVFNNSPILNVPVTARTSGNYTLRLVESHNKDEAKFYDETMAPFYPSGGVVTIQSK